MQNLSKSVPNIVLGMILLATLSGCSTDAMDREAKRARDRDAIARSRAERDAKINNGSMSNTQATEHKND